MCWPSLKWGLSARFLRPICLAVTSANKYAHASKYEHTYAEKRTRDMVIAIFQTHSESPVCAIRVWDSRYLSPTGVWWAWGHVVHNAAFCLVDFCHAGKSWFKLVDVLFATWRRIWRNEWFFHGRPVQRQGRTGGGAAPLLGNQSPSVFPQNVTIPATQRSQELCIWENPNAFSAISGTQNFAGEHAPVPPSFRRSSGPECSLVRVSDFAPSVSVSSENLIDLGLALTHFRPKSTNSHTLFQTWLSKCIPWIQTLLGAVISATPEKNLQWHPHGYTARPNNVRVFSFLLSNVRGVGG